MRRVFAASILCYISLLTTAALGRDPKPGAVLKTLDPDHKAVVAGAAITPDGSLVATGSGDETAKVTEVKTGAVVATLKGHESYVRAVAFTKDGLRVATGGEDKRQGSGTPRPGPNCGRSRAIPGR